MKKRIIALALVIVMSVLALVGCSGSYDCSEIDFVSEGYATFDAKAFEDGLKNIKIEDGKYTTNADTRAKVLAETIYNAVAEAIATAATDDDKKKDGELDEYDVLYFVYYAVDEKTGNVYFTADMKESAITSSSTKANHVIKLGSVDLESKEEDTEFVRLIKKNLQLGAIADFIYDMDDEAVAATDYKPADGNTVVISYSLSYDEKSTDAEGKETSKVINKSAAYETVTLKAGDAFSDKLIAGEKTFEIERDGVKYKYSDVKVLWKVEKAGKEIATFKYTPYDTAKTVTPDNLRVTTETKPDLKNVELTYHVFPVYYLDAPSAEALDAKTLLTKVYGSKLTEKSFEVLADKEYKNGDETFKDLLEDISALFTPVVNTTDESKTGDFYKKDSELRKLYDAHDAAVKAGGDKPTDAQKKTIEDAKAALTKEQNKELEKIVDKIVAAKKGSDEAGAKILEEYKNDTKHSLTESYNSDILEKIQEEVWELINKTVTVSKDYPEKLLDEFWNHLYEQYEYDYHNGAQTTGEKKAFYDVYETLEDYIRSADCKFERPDFSTAASKKDVELNDLIAWEAKYYIDPIIKIYVVSQYVADKAVAAMPGYVQSDIDNGGYDVDEKAYINAYGEEYGKQRYEEALENAQENRENALKEAAQFIIDDAFMKEYKKEIGKAYYRQLLTEYGEVNLRASFQFNKLFYYLTSTNLVRSNEGGTNHTEPAYKTVDGVDYIDFRNVVYTVTEYTGSTEDDHDGHDH